MNETAVEQEKARSLPVSLEQIISDILGTIEREREREIVARRFGLFDRKETLEQIGELLGITRERVRQLEKAVVARLKSIAYEDLPHVAEVEKEFIKHLQEMGNAARISDLTARINPETTKIDQSRISFLAQLSPSLSVIDDSDHFHHSVGIAKVHDEKAMKQNVDTIIDAVKKIGEPTTVEKIQEHTKHEDPKHIAALASTSKNLATLNGRWGLVKWPMVNPKNIRDKI